MDDGHVYEDDTEIPDDAWVFDEKTWEARKAECHGPDGLSFEDKSLKVAEDILSRPGEWFAIDMVDLSPLPESQ